VQVVIDESDPVVTARHGEAWDFMQVTVDVLKGLCRLMRCLVREGIMVLLAMNAAHTEGSQRRLSVKIEPIGHRGVWTFM
jgi:hypothetical protein